MTTETGGQTSTGERAAVVKKERPKQAEARKVRDRRKDYFASGRDSADFGQDVKKLYPKVLMAFRNKDDQIKDNKRYWDIYNCILDFSYCQQYRGDSSIYMPAVADAVDGLAQRGSAMLFPESGRYTECIAEDGKKPQAKMALLDHYVDRCKLQSTIKTLLRVGYVEGQFSVYVDWDRAVSMHTKKIPFRDEAPLGDDEDAPTVAFEDESETDVEDVEETLAIPGVSVVSKDDLAVVPETSDSIDDAIENGGMVILRLRVTQGWVEDQMRAGVFSKKAAKKLIEELETGSQYKGDEDSANNPDKSQAEAAGLKTDGSHNYALIYQCWTKMEFPDGPKDRNGNTIPELAVIHYAGHANILSAKRCPFWVEKCPILSTPDKKVKGSFFGQSRVDRVEQMQYAANDFANLGEDSAIYALLPIFAVDPTKAPQYNTMMINLAAVWKVPPDAIKAIQFPQLYDKSYELVHMFEARINQSMGLTTANVAMQSKGKKSQAEVANEQQIALMNVTDEIRRIETEILNPMLERFAEYDQQFRDEALTIEVLGELGYATKMEDIEPNQFMDRYIFKWRGTTAYKTAQMLQQWMAGLNVLRGFPPQLLPGKKIDFSPIIEEFCNQTYGPRVARLVLRDMEDMYSIPPDIENTMLRRTLRVIVRPTDNDEEHIQEHMKLHDDPNMDEASKQHLEMHIQMHQAQLQAKAMAAQQKEAQQQGIVGAPGAGGQPGMSGGGPRMGAVPGQGRMQGPPGAIHQDRLASPDAMPRRMG